MSPVYFDTSVFLALFKPEKNAKIIRDLLKELQDGKVRIYTSILSVQEASVLTFRRGAPARDNFARIDKIARIVNMNKEIALSAAKLEAFIADDAKEVELNAYLSSDANGIVFMWQPPSSMAVLSFTR